MNPHPFFLTLYGVGNICVVKFYYVLHRLFLDHFENSQKYNSKNKTKMVKIFISDDTSHSVWQCRNWN